MKSRLRWASNTFLCGAIKKAFFALNKPHRTYRLLFGFALGLLLWLKPLAVVIFFCGGGGSVSPQLKSSVDRLYSRPQSATAKEKE